MMRYSSLTLLACAILSGCTGSERPLRSMIGVKLPNFEASGDPDIVKTSLRPLPDTDPPKLPKKRVERLDLGVKLKNDYARLQFRFPLLPRRVPMQLTAIARSYWEPESIASPRGRFLVRLSLPLPFKQSWIEQRPSPPTVEHVGDQPVVTGLTENCTDEAPDMLAAPLKRRQDLACRPPLSASGGF